LAIIASIIPNHIAIKTLRTIVITPTPTFKDLAHATPNEKLPQICLFLIY
jgi:hypothetical protein